jgi:hypothetical protein
MKLVLSMFFFLATLIATSQGISHQIHLLKPHSGASGLSWRLAVETNNIREWDLVPQACENYVGHYMLGHQYRKDCNAAAYAAYQYAKSLGLPKDSRNVWIFDIDETALSNLPYYAQPDNAFG